LRGELRILGLWFPEYQGQVNNLCFLVQSTAIEAKLADHVWELPEAA
jgi:hypothetical protein